MRKWRRSGIVLAFALAAGILSGGASAAFQEPPQQKLLDRACNLAAVRIEKIVTEAATKQVLTVRTQVHVLRPGRLAADIAFNPSGQTLSVAADGSADSTVDYGCGYVLAGGSGTSGSAGSSEGIGVPKRHVVSVVREKLRAPGRYTLTFTIDRRGQRILARLGAAERAYRERHPHGKRPPTITWGVGIHYQSTL